jgi:hypothetical protein
MEAGSKNIEMSLKDIDDALQHAYVVADASENEHEFDKHLKKEMLEFLDQTNKTFRALVTRHRMLIYIADNGWDSDNDATNHMSLTTDESILLSSLWPVKK